ncbi:hypothetical protein [uncultured Ruminococcus sp.]|uniref:hypothetical protein n=1 Tax=uncultured Ruminococcus sp. TaxID=165186 RepID=UPI0026186FF4|nr:hypothetical protein [uncultured Ruminococcus sp.]
MFGRKRDEDYDEYNERYAAKYDDDYIAPSKEYRSECDHSHEQSYENINNVRECDHSHEQTYNDADHEQSGYDSYASLESRFEPLLAPNEHLLWVGGYDKKTRAPKGAPAASRNMTIAGFVVLGVLFMVGFCAFSDFLCFMFPIAFILAVVFLVKLTNASNGVHAITDMRVITLSSNGHPIYHLLKDIKNISVSMTKNNYGNVYFDSRTAAMNSQVQGSIRRSMNGVQDPARVKRILEDAVRGAMLHNGGR